MKQENTGLVGGIVVAMIHKGLFDSFKTHDERTDEIIKLIPRLGKAFE